MNISYSLWPIWCDYLEEQGQNTELLRYYFIWGFILPCNDVNLYNYVTYKENIFGEYEYLEFISGGFTNYGNSTYLSIKDTKGDGDYFYRNKLSLDGEGLQTNNGNGY